ncbi:DUF6208 family protein [Pannus brasiliensis CCIBt3594]|uniref:DUF6208 family protein n=1 Tax=Pannus brasiliensis CCIBt3594 TaxID=1427578 RepID=A0AAW9QT28_9CHRO
MKYLEIPLAVLSFLFYKGMKFLIGNLYTLYLIKDREKASRWRILSEETLRSPLSVPVLMTKGPRWNTHAIIGTLGPFAVRESIAVHLPTLKNSAKSWILVIYSFPDYETITNLDSNQIDSLEEWIEIPLKSGRYSIGLRYYDRTPPIVFPEVKIDGSPLAEVITVSENINDFCRDLIRRKNGFYLALHYYIYTILKYRESLGEDFVRREYLPVGAPDTEFIYDRLDGGQVLELEIEPSILEDYYVFLTLYDRSSLPVASGRVTEGEYCSERMENNGYYLIRLRPRSSGKEREIRSRKASSDPSRQRLAIRAREER